MNTYNVRFPIIKLIKLQLFSIVEIKDYNVLPRLWNYYIICINKYFKYIQLLTYIMGNRQIY